VNLGRAATPGDGPCTSALIDAGFARVVVGCRDPNPRVDGRGLALLRRAGIRVELGASGTIVWPPIEPSRSGSGGGVRWSTLKVAATLDGYIADGNTRRRRPLRYGSPVRRRARRRTAARAARAILVGPDGRRRRSAADVSCGTPTAAPPPRCA